MGKSELEAAFTTRWRQLKPIGAPDPVREHRFAPPRRWRFDFAWLDSRVAVEVEGGTWTGGRHVQGQGFADDCEKYNHAALDGWTVIRLTSDMLAGAPAQWIERIADAIGAAGRGKR